MMTPNSHIQEIEILKAVYAAINRNDIETALSFFDPQIERTEPEGFPSSGTYRGLADFEKHLRQGRATWAEGSCEPEHFQGMGNKVIAFLHVRVRLKNNSEWIDARFPDGFTFKNGKITEMRTFTKDQEAKTWAEIKS
ncbi:nuclear transport factor 2 family protein [Bdellovibrio sp. 22V]|uniref:nuclear transport factor 2 family protein n=1 Tax=Bdellovibrio sp. 22V TaxID=3044166 RepID=UPI0025438DEB|nr:nuclear transport factor 2 family protein [Bdellovibrio sp. 22V]WII70858.1 nuclear transport factor 2 family protein [Bdellovibrio sp. 22V]